MIWSRGHGLWTLTGHRAWTSLEGRQGWLPPDGRFFVEKGSVPFLCHLWSATQLPGALSSRLPSATAALVTQSPERSTLLWWQKQMPVSPHCHTQLFLTKCLALTTSSFLLTQGQSFSHHCCPLYPQASPAKGCTMGCVQSSAWCACQPLPLLLFSLCVSTWVALPTRTPCHFEALEFLWELPWLLSLPRSDLIKSADGLPRPSPPTPTEVETDSQVDGMVKGDLIRPVCTGPASPNTPSLVSFSHSTRSLSFLPSFLSFY